jgi:hypothetical protein
VNEAIAAAFYNIDEQKLAILKHAITKAIDEPDIADSTSEALSRAIRDISVEEARFIVNNFHHSKFTIGPNQIDGEYVHSIQPGSKELALVSGLISLGLIHSPVTYVASVVYEWTPLVAKLVRLLSK